jgi:hypothetical protein
MKKCSAFQIETQARRIISILSDLFRLQRSAIMSANAMRKDKTLIVHGISAFDKIPHDVCLPRHHAATGAAAPTSSFPHHTKRMTEQEDHNVSMSTPNVSTSKGNHKKMCMDQCRHTSTSLSV